MVEYRKPPRLSRDIDDRRSQATPQDKLRSRISSFGPTAGPAPTPKPRTAQKPAVGRGSGAAAQVKVPTLRSPRSSRTRRQTTKRPTSWPR